MVYLNKLVGIDNLDPILTKVKEYLDTLGVAMFTPVNAEIQALKEENRVLAARITALESSDEGPSPDV